MQFFAPCLVDLQLHGPDYSDFQPENTKGSCKTFVLSSVFVRYWTGISLQLRRMWGCFSDTNNIYHHLLITIQPHKTTLTSITSYSKTENTKMVFWIGLLVSSVTVSCTSPEESWLNLLYSRTNTCWRRFTGRVRPNHRLHILIGWTTHILYISISYETSLNDSLKTN